MPSEEAARPAKGRKKSLAKPSANRRLNRSVPEALARWSLLVDGLPRLVI